MMTEPRQNPSSAITWSAPSCSLSSKYGPLIDLCSQYSLVIVLARYQFVTPLTSLVVVKPDVIEDGDIQEADMFNRKIRVMSGAQEVSITSSLTISVLVTAHLFTI